MARDQSKLLPAVQHLADRLVRLCAGRGLKIKITDCVRTELEQNALSSAVTKVRYPNSYHCWGIAFDFCRNDGKGAYNTSGQFFEKVGAVGKTLGLVWGGDAWTNFIDLPHFQYEGLGTRSEIAQQFMNPCDFLAAYDVNIYDAPLWSVGRVSKKESIKWLQNQLNIETDAKLKIDGIYGKKLATAVLNYWESLGWNKDLSASGWGVGRNTIKALSITRK